MDPHLLLKRLDEIGLSLEKSGHALALIGLGSVGLELNRLDEYSDLDFFAIVEPGYKKAYLDDLSWLSNVSPIAYTFQNTSDGYKLLYADGIFCEFAVFEPDELRSIPFSPGRIVWKQLQIPDSISQPVMASIVTQKRDQEWLIGEALTNLLVGLMRELRGEKLSAMRFIQVYAVDRLLELAELAVSPRNVPPDAFTTERRFEQRFSNLVEAVAACMQGYHRNRESALAVLAFLERYFTVNEDIAAAIRSYCFDEGELG